MKAKGSFAVAALLAASLAQADVVRFDDARAALGEGNSAATYYLPSVGMTISGEYHGLVGGNGNGDPGNWNLEGTNGSAFLGCNSGERCSPTFSFNSTHNNLSLDVGMPGFGWSATLTLTAWLNNVVVDTDSITLTSPTDPGNWATLSISGAFDTVSLGFLSTGGNSFAFGIDNLVIDATNRVPEPASVALVALGLLSAAGVRRRRAQA